MVFELYLELYRLASSPLICILSMFLVSIFLCLLTIAFCLSNLFIFINKFAFGAGLIPYVGLCFRGWQLSFLLMPLYNSLVLSCLCLFFPAFCVLWSSNLEYFWHIGFPWIIWSVLILYLGIHMDLDTLCSSSWLYDVHHGCKVAWPSICDRNH